MIIKLSGLGIGNKVFKNFMEVISMRNRYKGMIFFILWIIGHAILGPSSIVAQDYIAPADAGRYIGQTKTVCGKVASTTYAVRSKGQPTFINLDQPYPNHIFTVVIWDSDRDKFKNPPEIFFKEKRVCVTGQIETYLEKPQIIVRDPSQVVIKTD
jgi:micrococcal nuclease